MEINKLLQQSRKIWWQEKLNLSQIIIRLWKVFGDICRWERAAIKDKETHTDDELQKELWNIIFSTIRWCDDLWYDPEECIKLAVDAQKKFKK